MLHFTLCIMRKILILLAHPKFELSKVNKVLIDSVKNLESVTINDLYESYPDFNIDLEKEKELLSNHDIIIWHHPIYWYSCPPLLKQWIDLVLEIGWAYGPTGNALSGKYIFNTITSGGSSEAYQKGGRNRFSLKEFLIPFEQTAYLCKMNYLPPFAVKGTHYISASDLQEQALQYVNLLRFLSDGAFMPENLLHLELLNHHIIA